MSYMCHVCGEQFHDELLLSAHMTLYHDNEQQQQQQQLYTCHLCGELYHDELLLTAHATLYHDNQQEQQEQQQHICHLCGEQYHDECLLTAHEILYHGNEQQQQGEEEGERSTHAENRPSVIHYAPPRVELVAQALEGAVVRHYKISNENNEEMESFLSSTKHVLRNTLQNELRRLHFVKFGLVLDTDFVNIENEVSNRGFLTRNRTVMESSDISAVLEECLQELVLKITEHEGRGSGWSLKNIKYILLRVHKHGYGHRGSSYIPLPKKIADTKSCINIQNVDNLCFQYAMLSKFLLNDKHLERPNQRYKDVAHKYNFKGLTYPVDVNDIKIFEQNNHGCSVNVFGVDDSRNIYPLKVTKELNQHTDLLLVKKGRCISLCFCERLQQTYT